MAISLVGTPQVGTINNGGNVTLTFNVTPSEGDVVVVFVGTYYYDAQLPSVVTSGYQTIANNYFNSAQKPALGAFYKVMTSSPDSNVQVAGNGSTYTPTNAIAYVLRGVNTSNVLDQTSVWVTDSGSSPNPTSITTQTDKAWVFAVGSISIFDATAGSIANYSNNYSTSTNETYDDSLAAATKEVSPAGSENPGTWGGWSAGSWICFTIAIRPAI